MSITEIKIYRIKCDQCDFIVKQESIYRPSLPNGWLKKEIKDCGSTGYTRTEHWCPNCVEVCRDGDD